MHIHILGICGTFMGGLALIARAAGHRVTGCDQAVYPPMSTQLQAQGIALIEGYDPAQLDPAPDLIIVGNVISRGNPLMETVLDRGLPYTSGPQWLGEEILRGQHVLAVAGTHGKTSTSAMLAWILRQARLAPNFLVGGIAHDLQVSAHYDPAGRLFVIEADEYDTAFFDKRSKFVHYRPRTAILNNLEYDHADIFPDLPAIETQFHHLVRMIPASGRILRPARSSALDRVLARGVWTPLQTFGPGGAWQAETPQQGSGFDLIHEGERAGAVRWALQGEHNRMNALAAIAAAHHVGVAPETAAAALSTFQGVKRRMELRGTVNGIEVYDDFAHHPTAIATTLSGLRRQKTSGRILAVLEPRSNTMKLGSMAARLPDALAEADLVYCYAESKGKHALGWEPETVLAPLGSRASAYRDLSTLIGRLSTDALPGDSVLIMSNGSFGGLHEKLLTALGDRRVGA